MPNKPRSGDRQPRFAHAPIVTVGATVLALALTSCSDSGPRAPEAPTLDPATSAQLRAKALSDAAAMAGLTDPPEVAVIRETSPFDYDQTLVDCLHDGGYKAEYDVSGGIRVDLGTGTDPVPADVLNQYLLATYVCMAQYPLDEIYLAPLSAGQKSAQADYYLEELPECLEGFGIAFATPPSREVFLANFDSVGAWTPYESAQISAAQWEEVVTACPQTVPPEQLWDRPES